MDYWMQQNENVCELCGGAHDTRQCANSYESMQFACNFQGQQYPVSNTYPPNPNFSWSNNQYGMQQSYQQSSPYQNQQYGAWPYESSEMQQAYEPSYSFQNQQYGAWSYDPLGFQQQQEQQFQPPEFQQQQFQTSSDQYSNKEAELKELRLMLESQAVSLKTMESQFRQIANALQAEQEAQEAEQRQRDIDSVVALLLAQPRPIEMQPAKDLGVEQEAEKEAEQEATKSENSESPENSEHSVLKNQPRQCPFQSENSKKSAQDQEEAKAQVAMQFPSEDEDYFRMEVVDTRPILDFAQLLKSDPLESALQEKSDIEDEDTEEQIPLLNSAPWQGSFDNPHESLGVEDLWNSQVRLKPSSEEAPKLELKPVPDHWGYTYVGESYTLPVITAANLSVIEDDKLLRVLKEFNSTIGWSKPVVEHQRMLNPITKEVEEEEILKWPINVDMKAAREKMMLQLSELDEFRHQAYENSRLFKEQIRKWLDRQLAYKALHPP